MSECFLTDEQIGHLLRTEKTITNPGAKWKTQRGSKQRNYSLEDEEGNHYTLYLRQNTRLPSSFSCGLSFTHPQAGTVTLTRYNGSDHQHSNTLDGSYFEYCCHIHTASERYAQAGRKPEHFALPTDRYSDLEGALHAIVTDCNILGIRPANSTAEQNDQQPDMFK